MRNLTIGYAKGEWILIIDADEQLEDDSGIIQFLKSNDSKKFKTAVINVKNYINLEKGTYGTIESPRLFYNEPSFKYIGSVHNRPYCGKPVILLQSSLKHYGYNADDKELMERKFQRTSKLLMKEIEQNHNDVYYNYQLSISYGMHGDNDKALKQMQKTYSIIEKEKLDKKEYIYIYYEYAMYYFESSEPDKYENSKRICEEGIKFEDDYIDLYFLLGKINSIQNEFKKAEVCFNKYLDLYENIKKLPISVNTMVKLYTIDKLQECYFNLAIIYYSEKKYKDASEYIQKVDNEEFLKKITGIFIRTYINLKDYNGIRKFYISKMYGKEEMDKLFIDQLEESIKKCSEKERKTVWKLFSNDMNDYSSLNRIRMSDEKFGKEFENKVDTAISSIDLNNASDYFGDLIYYKIKLKKDVSNDLFYVGQGKIVSYIKYCIDKYSDFKDVIKNYIDINRKDEYASIRLNKIFERVILILNSENADTFRKYFSSYVSDGIRYISLYYNSLILENEFVNDVKNEEDGFFIYMNQANNLRNTDLKQYVNYLKKALEIYPCMKTGIKLLIEESRKKLGNTSDEFESYKIQIKNRINVLIDNNKLEDAEKLIKEYEDIVKGDMEIVLLKSRISVKKIKNKTNANNTKYIN